MTITNATQQNQATNGGTPPGVSTPSTAMVIGTDAFRGAIEPANRDQAWELAECMASVGAFGLKTAAEALAKLMYGRTLGIPAVHAFQSLHTIEGKIGADAALLHGICLRSPLCEYFEPVLSECDMTKATFVTKRVGRPEQKLVYTIEEAEAMGVLDRGKDEEAKKKSNWSRVRKLMLMARCKSMLARAVYPDLTHGLHSTEELTSGEIDPDEMVGTLLTPQQAAAESSAGRVLTVQVAKRDWAKETADLKAQIDTATTRAEMAAVRDAIAKWDAVGHWPKEVADHYEARRQARSAAKTAPAPAESGSTTTTPLGDANLFTGKEPTK